MRDVSQEHPPPTDGRAGVARRLRAAGCVFADDEAELLVAAARDRTELAGMVDRRAAGVPLEHVLGWAELRGVRIAVDAGVFVPRRRTGLLVRQAAALARPGAVVVDLCCGAGTVGALLATLTQRLEIHAVDIDPAAVGCARRNLAAAGATVYQGDLYGPLPAGLRGSVDLVVANAPYVPADEIRLLPGEARDHEPPLALDGGVDGLDVLARVVADAPGWLTPGGHLLVESSARQAPRLVELCGRSGLTGSIVRCDDLDATIVIGQSPRWR